MRGRSKRFRILAGLAIGAVSLGTAGLVGRIFAGGDGPGLGQFFDALMEATSYLTLNGFGPIEAGADGLDGVAIWSIRAARLLALAFVVIGIGVVVDALIGTFDNLRFRWRATRWFGSQELDLVWGLTGPGLSFIDKTCPEDQAANRRTLAIDAEPSMHAIEICQRSKVPLLIGDAGDLFVGDADDEAVPVRLKLDRIARVFVSTGSDETNLRILFRLAEQVSNGRRGDSKTDILCVVHLADTAAHAPLLKALPQGDGLDFRVFNAESVTVRELYRLYPLDRFGPAYHGAGTPPVGVHLVVLGDGAMADQLLFQALQLNIYELDLLLKVDVLCDNPGNSADLWQSRHSGHPHREDMDDDGVCLKPDGVWVSEKVLPKIGFHLLPNLESRQIAWCEKHCGKPGWVTTFVIALRGPNAAAAVALGLAETMRTMRKNADVELWIYARQGRLDDIKRLFDPDDVADENKNNGWIHIFRDYLGEYRRDLAVARETDEAAKRVNHIYRWSGDGDETQFLANDTKKNEHWRECNEVDRESSRQAAVHAWVKQRIVRRQSGRDTGSTGAGDAARGHMGYDSDRLLAAIEHRRWCAQQLLAGMMPLVIHPTSSAPEEWDAEDLEKAKAWFKLSETKKSWKKRNRHIDLMPFASLAHLNAVKAGLGDKEQAKDLHLALLTDYIVAGAKGEAEPEETQAD